MDERRNKANVELALLPPPSVSPTTSQQKAHQTSQTPPILLFTLRTFDYLSLPLFLLASFNRPSLGDAHFDDHPSCLPPSANAGERFDSLYSEPSRAQTALTPAQLILAPSRSHQKTNVSSFSPASSSPAQPSTLVLPSCSTDSSEYLSPYDELRPFISGFTGSAGTAIIEIDKAFVPFSPPQPAVSR